MSDLIDLSHRKRSNNHADTIVTPMVIMATMKQATYHILAQLKGPTLRFRYNMSCISNSRLDILQLIRRNSDKF